jgi:hypothetical protein
MDIASGAEEQHQYGKDSAIIHATLAHWGLPEN